jgi:hypothetical protein
MKDLLSAPIDILV